MSQSHSPVKARHRKPWSFWISGTAISLFVLLIIIRLSMPYVIKWSAVSWLESQQLQAAIVDVDIFLLDGIFILKGLSATDNMGKGFSLEQLVINWQWSPLTHRQVIIDKIDVGPLKLDVALYDNGGLSLGGIKLPASTTPDQATPDDTDPGDPWDIKLSGLKLSDIKVCIDEFTAGNTASQQSCVLLPELTWAGQIAVMASEQVTAEGNPPVYIKGALHLSNPDVCIKQFNPAHELALDYCAGLTKLNWSGDISLNPPGQSPSEMAIPLYVDGSLKIDDLKINNNILDLSLVSLQSLNVSNVRLKTPNDLTVDEIQLLQLKALQRLQSVSDADAQVFAFDRLAVSSLKLTNLNDLVIDLIEMTDAGAYLQIHENGQSDYQPWIPVSKESEASRESESTSPFNFAVGKFIFNSQQHFVFYDTSLKVPFKIDAHTISLSLSGLNSKLPDSPSHLTLDMAIDRHGALKLDTDVMPLSKRPSFKGHGTISGFDLRLMSPMTKQHIGHNIRSGQLDTDLNIDVDKGIINSNMALSLHQFELKPLDKAEAEQLNSEFGFPLNSSLSLLRDRDNAIRLDIPITGDVDSPEFDPRDAIVKATSKAISTAVLHYYTPFGLVLAADALFNLATALSFEPVLFTAGMSTLTGAHEDTLNTLAALLNDRPGIHLTLCGFSNNDDRLNLFPPEKSAGSQRNEQTSTPAPMAPAQLERLQQLAESRSMVVKNHMVDRHSVDASRLIECSPEYIETGISGVEISI